MIVKNGIAAKIGIENIDPKAFGCGAENLYTPDYGLKWADLGVVSATVINWIVNLGNGIALLGDQNGHIFRSTNYGLTWTDLGIISSTTHGVAYLGNGIVVFNDANGHIFRSTDYGLTWSDLGVISASPFYGWMESLGNGVVVTGDGAGHVFRSTNYGLNWSDLGDITGTYNWAIKYLGNGIVILGDNNNKIWRSIDYGLNWSDVGVITTYGVYTIGYFSNGIAVCGDQTGYMFRSTDYGLTWASLGDMGVGRLRGVIYFGNGIAVLETGNGNILRTIDYGLTWSNLGVITGGGTADGTFGAYLGAGIVVIGDGSGHIFRSVSKFGSANFNPYQFDKLLQFGCLGAITPNGTSYLAPGNGPTQLNEITQRVTRPGILKNLFVQQRVASGAGGRTDIYTVRVNGADTAITCTLNNETQNSDTTHKVVVAQGDRVSIKLVSNDAADTSADVTATLELI